MNARVEKLQTSKGFTLMEVSLSVGIAASWILLSLGLMGLLVDQVKKNRQEPVWERSDSAEVPLPIQFKIPRTDFGGEEQED